MIEGDTLPRRKKKRKVSQDETGSDELDDADRSPVGLDDDEEEAMQDEDQIADEEER
jgi:hypothetical protein